MEYFQAPLGDIVANIFFLFPRQIVYFGRYHHPDNCVVLILEISQLIFSFKKLAIKLCTLMKRLRMFKCQEVHPDTFSTFCGFVGLYFMKK